jgi:DNA mismatch repair protein MutH
MDRSDAIKKLQKLRGLELHKLAEEHGVTYRGETGRENKGWAGHTVERFLGLPLNSSQSPNFGSWELKVIPIRKLRNGNLRIKETMAITMIDPINVIKTPFEISHLYQKLRKIVLVSRVVGNHVDEDSFVHDVSEIDLEDKSIYEIVKNDYNLVRDTLLKYPDGFERLTGRMGHFIQPRTKGPGHGSISRAFYAKKIFLSQFIKL